MYYSLSPFTWEIYTKYFMLNKYAVFLFIGCVILWASGCYSMSLGEASIWSIEVLQGLGGKRRIKWNGLGLFKFYTWNILVHEEKTKLKSSSWESLYTAAWFCFRGNHSLPPGFLGFVQVFTLLFRTKSLRLESGIDSVSNWVVKETKSTGCFHKYFVIQSDLYYLVIYWDDIVPDTVEEYPQWLAV